MVDININIKNTLFETQKLENAENNVLDEKIVSFVLEERKKQAYTYR